MGGQLWEVGASPQPSAGVRGGETPPPLLGAASPHTLPSDGSRALTKETKRLSLQLDSQLPGKFGGDITFSS